MIDLDECECPLCPPERKRMVTDEHHIIPRGRTSRKHPAWWLNDPRNKIWLCQECHKNDRPTRVRCVKVMMQRHPDWSFGVPPWAEYIEEET